MEDLPELPNASAEDEQLTLDMESSIARLQEMEMGEGLPGEAFSDEELEAAALELAQQEEREESTNCPLHGSDLRMLWW